MSLLFLLLGTGICCYLIFIDDGASTAQTESAQVVIYLESSVSDSSEASVETTAIYTYTYTQTTAVKTVVTELAVVTTHTSVHTEETVAAFPLNLNTATLEELMQLPGIGEVIAGNIISYREANGGFLNREQLLEVEGIGTVRYQEIYDLLYLDVEWFSEEAPLPEEWEEEPAFEEILPESTEWVPIVLDINTASAEDFAQIPGIDEELAQRIVEFREEIGGYQNVLELLYVEGMTDALYIEVDEYMTCTPEIS
ncbi:MAG: ComEA family DNA-binding protein [Ruminococcus sp.]